MFTSLALAPFAYGGWAFLPFFIIGHVFWFFLFVAIVIFLIVGRRRRFARWGYPGHFGNPAHSAEATLAERFAQGDIDEKEYRARLEVLRAGQPPVH